MKYQLVKDDDVIVNIIKLTNDEGQNFFIPMDEANTDYQEYIAWTKASPKNVAEPADE